MKLKDILNIRYGKNQSDVEVPVSNIPILGTGGIIGYSCRPLYTKSSVLIGRKGTIAKPFYIDKPFWTIDTLFYTEIDENKVIPKYLYYHLSSIELSRYQEGAAVPSLTTKTLYEIDIPVHSIKEQQHIVNTIGSVDDLIEKIEEKIRSLQLLSSTLYIQNYELNANDVVYLGNVSQVKTGKLNAEEADENGLYPFFTCGSKELRIDDPAFDCEAIIIAGNGEISVKHYKGKFNAYQRTYVLEPSEYFYLFLKECENSIETLKNNSQGSVIKFITKSMLENISIKVNNESSVINKQLGQIYNLMLNYKKQINYLNKIKNLLLNKYFTNL